MDIFPLIPPLTASIISFISSMGGISGAFLLLPFQVSILNLTGPAVSSTNLVYNIIAIPSGVYRFIKDGRLAWPLAWVIIIGTLPGMFIGTVIRIRYLLDPANFKFFVGCVLLYIGGQLLYQSTGQYQKRKKRSQSLESKFEQQVKRLKKRPENQTSFVPAPDAVVKTVRFSIRKCEYEFWGQRFSFNTYILLIITLIVGIASGTYGIGGGAIISPICIGLFGLPVYTVAGATLLATFVASAAGVIFYYAGSHMFENLCLPVLPDWNLGLLFGIGGFFGIYFGARVQKFIPEKIITFVLGLLIILLSFLYILQFFIKRGQVLIFQF